MGTDPGASVADAWCLAHDTPNLALSGSGCFPTSSGYNPTATIQALAWRTADRLVAEWERVAA
jgi:choline dehydrogenase-like flavoprotein